MDWTLGYWTAVSWMMASVNVTILFARGYKQQLFKLPLLHSCFSCAEVQEGSAGRHISVQYLPWKPSWGAWGSWSAALCALCPWYRPPEPGHSSGRYLTGGYSTDQSKQHLEKTNYIRNRTSVFSLLGFACSTFQACSKRLQQNSRALCLKPAVICWTCHTKCREWADMRNYQLNSGLPSPPCWKVSVPWAGMLLGHDWPALCSHRSPWHFPNVQRFLFRAWNDPSFTQTASALISSCHILHIILVHHFLICYIHLSLPHLLSIFLTQHRTEQAFMFLLPKPLQENISFSQNLLLGTTALSKASSCSIFGINCKDLTSSSLLHGSVSMSTTGL